MTSEIKESVNFADDANYLDATLGSGGHSLAIIKQILQKKLQNNKLFAFDVDKKAFSFFKARLKKNGLTFTDLNKEGNFSKINCEVISIEQTIKFFFFNENFTKINALHSYQVQQGPLEFNSILADLGPSQNLLENDDLGLSFQREAYLDMRLDAKLGVTAADLLSILPKNKLRQMFEKYADIKRSLRLAEIVVDYREDKKIKYTHQLNALVRQFISENKREKYSKKDYEKLLAKVYQALRVAVNLDYENLKEFLEKAFELISSKGNLIVITFQSGEERIVHRFAKNTGAKFSLHTPSQSEVSSNPRSRSAKMYVINCKPRN